jgi:hypothetical protein
VVKKILLNTFYILLLWGLHIKVQLHTNNPPITTINVMKMASIAVRVTVKILRNKLHKLRISEEPITPKRNVRSVIVRIIYNGCVGKICISSPEKKNKPIHTKEKINDQILIACLMYVLLYIK